MQIILVTQFYKPSGEFEKAGLKVFIEKYQDNKIILVISPSGIPSGKLETAARSLTDVIISKQKTVWNRKQNGVKKQHQISFNQPYFPIDKISYHEKRRKNNIWYQQNRM